MPRWLWISLLVLGGLLAWTVSGGPPAAVADASRHGGIPCPRPPAFTDPSQPLQSPVPAGLQVFGLGGATVTPLAGFSLQARVLSREDYRFGQESRFAPTDLALGWGPMQAEGMADRLNLRQSSRWYRYRWGNEGPPLPPAEIARNSANMHLVPADAAVARQIANLRAGQVLRLQGWLVRIDDPSGWHWQSSLSREDTGAGACELVLVCAIE
jgi:hypothetical protein